MIYLYYLILLSVFVLIYGLVVTNYKKTEYYKATHLNFLQMRFDKGRSGEYYTYKYLKSLPGNKRYLFNCYLPKTDGTTTEIDVILIHDSGIYVFESKNYSGWIFGTETQTKWTQTLPSGKGKSQKSYFFNPIIQNKVHIKWLQTYLQKEYPDLPFYSYIIFSDRCTLKNIKLTSDSHFVINRYNILQAVSLQASKTGAILSQAQIDTIYYKLYPLTQVDDKLKLAHIESIRHNVNKAPINANTVSDKPCTESETEAKINTADKTCPCCGGNLILRTARKGERSGQKFYGCSNFPKCRYIENIIK